MVVDLYRANLMSDVGVPFPLVCCSGWRLDILLAGGYPSRSIALNPTLYYTAGVCVKEVGVATPISDKRSPSLRPISDPHSATGAFLDR